MPGMKVKADRLVTGVWARPAPAFAGPSPYRKIESLRRQLSFGRTELVVTFTNGERAVTFPEKRWEIDQEIDQ